MDSRYRFLEEYSINHWPSLSTLMFDGWVLRFTDGYTRRANSISPLYPAGRGASAETSMDVIEKIRQCERIYAENRLPTIFKITPGVHPAHLDRVLEERGYSLADTCCVLTLHWEQLPEPEPAAVTIDEGDGSEWMAHFCAISGVTDRDTQILTESEKRIHFTVPRGTGCRLRSWRTGRRLHRSIQYCDGTKLSKPRVRQAANPESVKMGAGARGQTQLLASRMQQCSGAQAVWQARVHRDLSVLVQSEGKLEYRIKKRMFPSRPCGLGTSSSYVIVCMLTHIAAANQ